MKKYSIKALLIVIIFLSVACNDFLDTSSASVYTIETSFSQISTAEAAVVGIYSKFGANYDLLIPYCYQANDIEFGTFPLDATQGNISAYNATLNNGLLMYLWRNCYAAIDQANICIENLPYSPIWLTKDSTKSKQLYAEAVALRANAYGELIHTFGDVPFTTQSTSESDRMYLSKTNRDSIYEYLIEDLYKVENYSPWSKDINTNIRVTKGFVKGLRARLALAYAGFSLRNGGNHETRRGRYADAYYQIADQECGEIINSGKHSLAPDYLTLFKDLHAYRTNTDEIIFEWSFSRSLFGYSLGNTFGMQVNINDKKYGRASAANAFSPPTYFYGFDSLDIRRDVTVELYDYANSSATVTKQTPVASPSGTRISKWRRPWVFPAMGGDMSANQNLGIDFPILRYADILLMYAETQNILYGSPTNAAKDALKAVRKRAFAQNYWTEKVDNYVNAVAVDSSTFFNAIVDERAWELGGEGIRKYDLIRWNMLGSKIQQMKNNLKDLLSGFYTNVPDYLFWKYDPSDPTRERIIILNKSSIIPGAVSIAYLPGQSNGGMTVNGWNKTTWMGVGGTTGDSNIASLFNGVNSYIVRGCSLDPAKNNYLQPINSLIIGASKGTLNNDQLVQ
ncbi:MAG: RagB/SusD family nutrient uptake outer membrane protein [Paludibacter sp.]|nr:RagB/SusD family nutrient uptake outer membrane protein [Paludibacter sp.]